MNSYYMLVNRDSTSKLTRMTAASNFKEEIFLTNSAKLSTVSLFLVKGLINGIKNLAVL